MSGRGQSDSVIEVLKEEIENSLQELKQIYNKFSYLPHAYRDNSVYGKINEFHSTLGSLLNAADKSNREYEREFSRLTEQGYREYNRQLQQLLGRITEGKERGIISHYGDSMVRQKRAERETRSENKDYLARTIYGEARGENYITKKAIAWTIRNRADQKNRSIKAVVTQKGQFDAWKKSDPNYEATNDPEKHSQNSIIDRKAWLECLEIAEQVLNAPLTDDLTQGATHYYDDSGNAPNWTSPKKEPNVHEVTIEGASKNVHFYKGVRYSILEE